MSTSLKPRVILTDRFFTAVVYATTMHRDQVRKSTDNPYICHPLGVASLVIEAHGDEDQAIAALLHDVAEDCGGEPRLQEIKQIFGGRVEAIVRGCSDSLVDFGEKNTKYEIRKQTHLDHLKLADYDVLLVTAADKLHNARAIATDLQTSGSIVWERFSADPVTILGYYNEILKILQDRGVASLLLNPLASMIKFMEANHE